MSAAEILGYLVVSVAALIIGIGAVVSLVRLVLGEYKSPRKPESSK